MIIDANHIIEYLKYTSTHKLLTRSGQERNMDGCLSAISPQSSEYSLSCKLLAALVAELAQTCYTDIVKLRFGRISNLDRLKKARGPDHIGEQFHGWA
jgi:hypothetical protein